MGLVDLNLNLILDSFGGFTEFEQQGSAFVRRSGASNLRGPAPAIGQIRQLHPTMSAAGQSASYGQSNLLICIFQSADFPETTFHGWFQVKNVAKKCGRRFLTCAAAAFVRKSAFRPELTSLLRFPGGPLETVGQHLYWRRTNWNDFSFKVTWIEMYF